MKTKSANSDLWAKILLSLFLLYVLGALITECSHFGRPKTERHQMTKEEHTRQCAIAQRKLDEAIENAKRKIRETAQDLRRGDAPPDAGFMEPYAEETDEAKSSVEFWCNRVQPGTVLEIDNEEGTSRIVSTPNNNQP